MSHRWNCHDEYEARREGERAYEYGRSRSSNPYEDSYWNRDRACPDAENAWDRGYRAAEIRDEEEREEAAARQRAAMRRAEEEAEEYAYYERQQYEYAQRIEDEARAQEYYAELEAQEAALSDPARITKADQG